MEAVIGLFLVCVFGMFVMPFLLWLLVAVLAARKGIAPPPMPPMPRLGPSPEGLKRGFDLGMHVYKALRK